MYRLLGKRKQNNGKDEQEQSQFSTMNIKSNQIAPIQQPPKSPVASNKSPSISDEDAQSSKTVPQTPHQNYLHINSLFEIDNDPIIPNNNVLLQQAIMQTQQTQPNYAWKEFKFEKLKITTNKRIRNSMLLSVHLQAASMAGKHVKEALDSPYMEHVWLGKGADKMAHYSVMKGKWREIERFITNSPTLYQQNKLQEIAESIQDSSDTIQDMKQFFGRSIFETPSNSLKQHAIQERELAKIKPAWQNQMDAMDITLYNRAIRNANFNEEALDEELKLSKDRTFNVHQHDGKELCIQSLRHLYILQSMLQAIKILLTDDGKIVWMPWNLEAVPTTTDGFFKLVLPDAQTSLHLDYYTALQHIYLPVSFFQALIWKLLLHSRRSYFGLYQKNLKLKLSVEQRIIEEPEFDVLIRYSFTDNCPPIQERQLIKLQNKIKMDYDKLVKEYGDDLNVVEDDYEHNDEWLNNVFLLGSILTTEFGANFGIINHYEGDGELRCIPEKTRTIYYEFSILRFNHGNVTIDDIEEIKKKGKMMNSNIQQTINEGQLRRFVKFFENEPDTKY